MRRKVTPILSSFGSSRKFPPPTLNPDRLVGKPPTGQTTEKDHRYVNAEAVLAFKLCVPEKSRHQGFIAHTPLKSR